MVSLLLKQSFTQTPPRDRKVFYRTVAGLLAFGVVTIGLRAASHIVTRHNSTVVARSVIQGYDVTATAYPINPNDTVTDDGSHADGYYYVCNVAKGGMPISTYTLKPWKGFKSQDTKIEYLPTYKSNGVTMLDVNFETENTGSMCVYCKISKPGPNENYGADQVEWRGLRYNGI
jgi:hypothetical protein